MKVKDRDRDNREYYYISLNITKGNRPSKENKQFIFML